MTIEELSEESLASLAQLFTELWPESSYEEEFEYCKTILRRKDQIAFLAKEGNQFIGFSYFALRKDFVEGALKYPVAYLEAVFVQEEFRKKEVARKLVQKGIDWGKLNGCTQLGSDTEVTNEISILFHKQSGFDEANRVVCFIRDI